SFADTYTITNTSLTRPFFGGLTYGTIESLTLNAENGDNTINVAATATGTPVTINAGGGNDGINLGTGLFRLFGLLAPGTVNRQAGSDTLTLIDENVTVSSFYTVTSTTVTRQSFGGLTYGTIENLTLNAGLAPDIINVTGTAPGTAVTVNAGGGDDII